MFTIPWPWQKKREIEDDTELGLTTEQEDSVELDVTIEQDLVARIVTAGGESLVTFVADLISGMAKNFGYTCTNYLWFTPELKRLLEEVGTDEFEKTLLTALYRVVDKDDNRILAPNFGYSRYHEPSAIVMGIEIGCWSEM